jgi:hypothetical protein
MKSARQFTTATIEEESIDLHQEKANLVNLVLTIKSLFGRKSLKNGINTVLHFVTSGVFLRAIAAIMSILWMLIIIVTVFLV